MNNPDATHQRLATFFYPSHDGSRPLPPLTPWFLALAAALAALGVLAYVTIYVDHPFLIATTSRALYVDEGFYSDAAQNFVKFGRWGFPFDFPHWGGSPFLTLIQTAVFSASGPGLVAARLISIVLSLVACLAFYSIARTAMRPAAAALLTLSGALTISYTAHARVALADPTAVCLSIVALLVFVRVRSVHWAIPLSLAFGFAAFLSKMYFLFSLVTIAALWISVLFVIPMYNKQRIDWRAAGVFLGSVAALAGLFAAYLYLFGDRLADYYAINSDKIPFFDPGALAGSILVSLKVLPYNTKTHVYLAVVVAVSLYALLAPARPARRQRLYDGVRALGRADYAMGLWLLIGLATIGVLQLHKAHYHFFAILPLCLAGATCLKLAVPARRHTLAISAAAVLQLAFQVPYYDAWAGRSQKTAIVDASREIARYVEQRSGQDMIPVIGEYASQLGLFSEKVFPLDAKWTPSHSLCARLGRWEPRYHVNVVWPGSISRNEKDSIASCRFIEDIEEVERFRVFGPNKEDIVLSVIHYEHG